MSKRQPSRHYLNFTTHEDRSTNILPTGPNNDDDDDDDDDVSCVICTTVTRLVCTSCATLCCRLKTEHSAATVNCEPQPLPVVVFTVKCSHNVAFSDVSGVGAWADIVFPLSTLDTNPMLSLICNYFCFLSDSIWTKHPCAKMPPGQNVLGIKRPQEKTFSAGQNAPGQNTCSNSLILLSLPNQQLAAVSMLNVGVTSVKVFKVKLLHMHQFYFSEYLQYTVSQKTHTFGLL